MIPTEAPPTALGTTPGIPLPPGVLERRVEVGATSVRYLTGGSGPSEPVLFLHGWPTWAEVWLPVAMQLGTRHPWIAMDLPGQGQSSVPPRAARGWKELRGTVASFTDSVGPEHFVVVGNSMGGTLAIMLALDRPDRVTRLVAIDPAGLTPRLPGRTARMYLPFVLRSYFGGPTPAQARRLLVKTVFHDPTMASERWVSAVVDAWTPRERRTALRDLAYSLRRPEASVHADLPRITQPTLVVSGRADVQFPWESARLAARRIPGARFAVIDHAGHFPMVEAPSPTAEVLADFLGD